MGTTNTPKQTFQSYNKRPNLVTFIKENNQTCYVILALPINRLSDGKTAVKDYMAYFTKFWSFEWALCW